ncbi:hypothetical protein GCM10010211_68100 [Streptomyces albospinus]|uniref:Uncharacterized protein n=1 Tax=Streptomyces albospinus TaxID=285515 RepID=A0ABQ2VJQ0_9ACTN|nr:hypothetical protein GCM10010211_68100 [Streptomyces albospinus]
MVGVVDSRPDAAVGEPVGESPTPWDAGAGGTGTPRITPPTAEWKSAREQAQTGTPRRNYAPWLVVPDWGDVRIVTSAHAARPGTRRQAAVTRRRPTPSA